MNAISNEMAMVDLQCTPTSYTLWDCEFPSDAQPFNSCFTIRYTAPHLGDKYFENIVYLPSVLNSIKSLGNSLLLDINLRCPNKDILSLGVSLDSREFDNSVIKSISPNGNLYYFEPSFILCQNPASTVNVTLYTDLDPSNCSIINLYYYLLLLSITITTIIFIK